jgi:hypothetical protein
VESRQSSTQEQEKESCRCHCGRCTYSQSTRIPLKLLQYISRRLPSFEVSCDYAELYLISGPGSSVGDDELYEKVEHPTRLLHCETPQGIIHITKHIKPDILLTAPADSQPISDLRGITQVNPRTY